MTNIEKTPQNKSRRPKSEGRILDTIAQLPPKSSKPPLTTLQKRARSKWYTIAVVSKLKYLEDTVLRKYYSIAWNCCDKLYHTGTTVTARYCNTRVCHVCNRIRTGNLTKSYIQQFTDMEDVQFVTLTVRNCKADKLAELVDRIIKQIVLVIRNIREKKGIKINGIRKIEITYNAIADTYHPHLHLLVDKGLGHLIVDQWLQRMPDAQRQGWDFRKKKMVDLQVVQKADKGSLNELFKYTTKIIYTRKKGSLTVYVKPLDNIMTVLYRRRTFQPFGLVRSVSEDVDNLVSEVYPELELYDVGDMVIEWIWDTNDWYFDGVPLTGYTPPELDILFK